MCGVCVCVCVWGGGGGGCCFFFLFFFFGGGGYEGGEGYGVFFKSTFKVSKNKQNNRQNRDAK